MGTGDRGSDKSQLLSRPSLLGEERGRGPQRFGWPHTGLTGGARRIILADTGGLGSTHGGHTASAQQSQAQDPETMLAKGSSCVFGPCALALSVSLRGTAETWGE